MADNDHVRARVEAAAAAGQRPQIKPATRVVRAGLESDTTYGSVVPPIYLSSTYTFADLGMPRAHDYSRSGNPTRDILADALTDLEGGAGGVVTGTGTGAMTCTITALAERGRAVAMPHDCYGGTWRLFDELAKKGLFDLVSVDYTDLDAVRALFAGENAPSVAWIETPSNPLLRITDIAAVTEIAHAAGAVVVVDNTFLSPLLQRPLSLGADVVVHSTTKYINGHSDVVGGAVIAAHGERAEHLAWWANVLGVTGGSFDSYLAMRGLRTIHTRLGAHAASAEAVVAAAVGHPAVAAVYYPGLASHPGHELAQRQQDGFGSMVSIDLVGGTDAVRRYIAGLQYFSLAESLGGVESLVCHPATMTHAAMPLEVQAAAGITPGLLRLSVGMEDPQDLAADVTAALDRAANEGAPVAR